MNREQPESSVAPARRRERPRPPGSSLRRKAARELKRRHDARESVPQNSADLEKVVHELEVHQVELEMQNDELRATHQDLETSRKRYADLYDFAPIGYLDLDDIGRIRQINLTGAELLGIPRGRLVGRRLGSFFVEPSQLRFMHHLRASWKAQQTQAVELELQRAGAKPLPVELCTMPAQQDDELGWVCRCTLADITDRKAAQALLRANQAQLETQVKERTAQLAETTDALRAEVRERKHLEQTRQDIFQKLVTAEEEERSHIARELHDQMGQHLTAMSIGLKALEKCVSSKAASQQLRDLQRLSDQIGHEVHQIAFALRPTALDDLGLQVMLRNYLEDWSARFGVKVDYHPGEKVKHRLPVEVETTAYRIVQEALTNVAKHANARHLSLILARNDADLSLVIEDDGKGFNPDKALGMQPDSPRLGLAGMRERVALAGGSFQIESTPGQGTTIFVRVPLRSPPGVLRVT